MCSAFFLNSVQLAENTKLGLKYLVENMVVFVVVVGRDDISHDFTVIVFKHETMLSFIVEIIVAIKG